MEGALLRPLVDSLKRRLASYFWQSGMLEPLLQLRDVAVGNRPRQQAGARAFTTRRNRQFSEQNWGCTSFHRT